MELFTVRHHARLRRKRCRDAVTSRYQLDASGMTCSRCTRNTNTIISLGLETTTVVADSRVPRHEVLHSESAVFAYNLNAGVALNRKVKVSAACN